MKYIIDKAARTKVDLLHIITFDRAQLFRRQRMLITCNITRHFHYYVKDDVNFPVRTAFFSLHITTND